MSRSVPNMTLARYHLRHVVPQPGCPLCMLGRRPVDAPPRWMHPRLEAVR